MTTVDEFLATAAPRTITVPVCSRGDLVDEHDALQERLNAMPSDSLVGTGSEGAAVAGRISELEAEIERCTLQVKVRSIGNRAWADLKARHYPSKEERQQGLDVHMVTFPVAAVAASVVEPELTATQVEQMSERLPTGEWMKLWTAVLGVNLGVLDTPKSVAASAVLRANEHSSTTSDPDGSLAAGSSDDPGGR